MGILTLGLLGVASVFPVGSFYMQKAEISDKGSAIAQSVMNDIMARGMLNPRSWYVMIPYGTSTTLGVWNTTFPSDGKYSKSGTAVAGTFTRPFATALAEALNQPTAATDSTLIGKQFGSAYVIDPIGVSFLAFRDATNSPSPSVWSHGPAELFPATAYMEGYYYLQASASWAPWLGSGSQPYLWPIRRATFRQPASGWQLDAQMAEHYFRGDDDLSFDFPARDDRPAIQTWDTRTNASTGITTPLGRKWAGDYSWIVTVTPPTNAARNGMATNPEGFAYNVSVVVFYKRVLPDSADTTYNAMASDQTAYHSAMGANERAVKAGVISTGLNGGELLLTDFNDAKDASGKPMSAFDQLRTGQWIMLCGPHPNSNAKLDSTTNTWKGEPQLALNWYQVISIEPVSSDLSNMTGYDSSKPQRLVTVRGPEWPWQPSNVLSNAANALCVAICKGAVAVHTKSIRLEGSGEVGFGSSGNATTTPPPWVLH